MSSDWQPGNTAELRLALVDVEDPGAEALDDPQFLSPEEMSRARRFRGEELSRRYRRAHAALRILLARELGCEPAAVPIVTPGGGKPRLRQTDVRFNLSHSGSLVAVALARGREVGIDVEVCGRELGDVVDLAGRVGHANETLALAAIDGRGRDDAFLRLWTMREALLKALGTGLIGAPTSIDTSPVLHGVRSIEWNGWSVKAVPAPAGCFVAVAAEGAGWGYRLVSPLLAR